MNKLLILILGIVLLIFHPMSTFAEEVQKTGALHGGQLRKAGPYYLELVAKHKEIVLYVTDHAGNEVGTENGTGKVSIQSGKNEHKITLELEPVFNNILRGEGEFLIKPDTAVIAFIKLPEQEAYTARFTPLNSNRAKDKADMSRHHHDDHDHDHDH